MKKQFFLLALILISGGVWAQEPSATQESQIKCFSPQALESSGAKCGVGTGVKERDPNQYSNTTYYFYYSERAAQKLGFVRAYLKNGESFIYTLMSQEKSVDRSTYNWSDTIQVRSISPSQIQKYEKIVAKYNESLELK